MVFGYICRGYSWPGLGSLCNGAMCQQIEEVLGTRSNLTCYILIVKNVASPKLLIPFTMVAFTKSIPWYHALRVRNIYHST